MTGLSALSVSSVNTSANASGANSVVANDLVTLVVTAAAVPVELQFTIKCTA